VDNQDQRPGAANTRIDRHGLTPYMRFF